MHRVRGALPFFTLSRGKWRSRELESARRVP